MGKLRTASAAVALWVSFTGCYGNEPVQGEPDPLLETVYELAVIDTIGVLSGDSNLVFGDIAEASFTVSGDILILDRMNGRLSLFSGDGDLITWAGGLGEAPWEFSWATSFAPMFDGRLIVSDYAGRKTVIFTDSLSYIEAVSGYQRAAPAMLSPLPDGSFAGRDMELTQDAHGELHGENQIRRFSPDSSGYITQYMASPMFITLLDDGIDVKPASIMGAASIDGTVYCAVGSDSLYEVSGYATGGELTVSISEPWERVPKTAGEIAEEGRVTAMETDEDGTRTPVVIDVEVEPFFNAVKALSTDDLGRLWVRLGSPRIPTFRVYDGHGEYLFTVTCPELEDSGRQVSFQTRHGGVVGWDSSPLDYPKVYVMELRSPADD